ncbi:chemotaxis protein MotB [Brevibacillus aydinogluensis]|jgi:chemotaxis protein MotB|uniref:OmpA/MotB family protein n=1 Tax=Brevibacillus aydinogluensis TaxID=927786 RepID=UPI002892FA7F|nr:flagellar motor protein MotB [Brevibacillus aydinogluensis]MDT3417704.1 chemotaxis protein MotB [Brevibacillus aydinogluensis]
MHDDRLYDEKELEKSWLISYSDLFTLLFVIVVIIAAAHATKIKAQMDEAARQQASLKQVHESLDLLNLQKLELEREIHQLEARREALAAAVEGKSAGESHPRPEAPPAASDAAKRDMETIRTQLASVLQAKHVDFEETGDGLRVRLPETILFGSGSADLKDEGKQVVDVVARVLKRFSYRVRIEGCTDDTPAAQSPYRSNWELSSARAIAVMRELVNIHGLPASRFTVAGWGEHATLVDKANAGNGPRNNRVDLLILVEKE